MDWQLQFIVAFMSIVCIADVTSSDSPAYSLHVSASAMPSKVNAKLYSYANGAEGGVKKLNINDSVKSYPRRRSYSAKLSAALNGLRDYAGLHHISTSYMPIPKATSTSSSDKLDGKAIEAKQQLPIYEKQPENDYVTTAAATSPGTNLHTEYYTENNQHFGHNALSAAIYNLHEAGMHNSYYGGSSASTFSPSATATSSSWPTNDKEAWSPTDDFEQFLEANDKSKVNRFQPQYDHNSGYSSPSYTEQNIQEHVLQEYSPQQHFQPYFTHSDGAHNEEHYEESTNYLPKPDEHFESDAHSKHQEQQPDVINYVPYPVVKKLHVPVRQPIQIPVSHAVIMPVSRPVPIHIPVSQQVQVPVEKDLRIPLERIVPYPVERHVPVPVEKPVPYPVVRYVPVKVPHPFPIKVPVYKTVLHKMKSLW